MTRENQPDHRDDPPTSATPAAPVAAAEARAHAHVREILAQYGQPALLEPPPGLRDRVLASLPPLPPAAAAAARRRRRHWALGLSSLLLLPLLLLASLGIWGVLIESSGPAHLFGPPAAGAARLVLLLVLAAKPLVHILLAPGATTLAATALVWLALAWLWWQMLRHAPRLHLAPFPEPGASQ